MKLLIILFIACFVAGGLLGYGLRLEQGDRYELIEAMEDAKRSHQEIVNHPDYLARLREAGFTADTIEEHRDWVEMYQRIIDELRYR